MSKLATIGDNNPPSEYETIKSKIEDLYDEAKGWIDGDPIQNQEQADQVEKLVSMIKEATKEADELRKGEVQPYDEAKAKIQGKYNLLIGKTKSVTGKAVLALEACRDTLTPWKQAVQAKKDEEARRAKEEAERLRLEAEQALQAASIEDREKAQALQAASLKADKASKRIQKDTVKGMRTVWDVVVTDETEAFRSMWKLNKSEIMQVVQKLAEQEVGRGIRKINGFDISSRKVAR